MVSYQLLQTQIKTCRYIRTLLYTDEAIWSGRPKRDSNVNSDIEGNALMVSMFGCKFCCCSHLLRFLLLRTITPWLNDLVINIINVYWFSINTVSFGFYFTSKSISVYATKFKLNFFIPRNRRWNKLTHLLRIKEIHFFRRQWSLVWW